jgi:hyperosmotically inducible periplasmic protein
MTRLMIRSCGLIVFGASLLTPAMGLASSTPAVFAQKVPDDTLRDRVAYKIETYPTTKKYDIHVRVTNGDVLLTGSVGMETQKAEAGRLARIQGVGKVDNQIRVTADADKTLMDRAKGGMNRAGEAISDTWITTKVKWFFVGDDLLKGSKISVETTNRVVTLTGNVMSEAGKKRAILLAEETDGVTKVVNNLTVIK